MTRIRDRTLLQYVTPLMMAIGIGVAVAQRKITACILLSAVIMPSEVLRLAASASFQPSTHNAFAVFRETKSSFSRVRFASRKRAKRSVNCRKPFSAPRATVQNFQSHLLGSSSGDSQGDTNNPSHGAFFTGVNHCSPRSIGIVGGGLAGLSVAYHLLQKSSDVRVTIIDKNPVGTGGASAVAGGLLHPFSPRGKLVHFGLEGLRAANSLIDAAQKFEPSCVLREEIYRIALTSANVEQLQQTAENFPMYSTWLAAEEIEVACGVKKSMGGLRLTNGCKVLHVPSYLRGLWAECEELSGGTAEWSLLDLPDDKNGVVDWKDTLEMFDTVVLAAGAGLLHDKILQSVVDVPAQLVRGQSVEMLTPSLPSHHHKAVLCGKYLAPLPGPERRVLVGATHEFGPSALTSEEIAEELKARTYSLAPDIWDKGEIERITSGWRVQAKRGKYGRIPIIGRVLQGENVHKDTYLFTGLSSRGILHHGFFGELLSAAILENTEASIFDSYPELAWWK